MRKALLFLIFQVDAMHQRHGLLARK